MGTPSFALLLLTAGYGFLAVVGNLLLGTAIAMGLLGFVRAVQGGRTGKAFRAGRPFLRP